MFPSKFSAVPVPPATSMSCMPGSGPRTAISLSFQSRWMPALMASFIRSYFSATRLKTWRTARRVSTSYNQESGKKCTHEVARDSPFSAFSYSETFSNPKLVLCSLSASSVWGELRGLPFRNLLDAAKHLFPTAIAPKCSRQEAAILQNAQCWQRRGSYFFPGP